MILISKRIGIITSSFPAFENDPSGAAGFFVKDFAILLSDKYSKIPILTPYRKNSNFNNPKFKVQFFRWLGQKYGFGALKHGGIDSFFRFLSALLSGSVTVLDFIKKNKIDCCIAMWAVPSGIFALVGKFSLKTPYVVWCLGSDVWDVQNYPFGKFILKKVFKNANKIYADGIELCKDVERISGLPCTFLPSNRLLEKTEKPINYSYFDKSKINFIFLGRFHNNKGIDLLIQSIELLSKEEKEKTKFHIFGQGPLEDKIKKMVIDFGLTNIIINSWINEDEVFSYISKADYVIIPSRIESIPVVLANAIESRKPVLLTNVGDMGILAKRFHIGIISEPNSKSIAKGIQKIISIKNEDYLNYLKKMPEFEEYLSLKKSVQIISEYVETINKF